MNAMGCISIMVFTAASFSLLTVDLKIGCGTRAERSKERSNNECH
jgi:hypothetical protein